jgi:hypothetical protein
LRTNAREFRRPCVETYGRFGGYWHCTLSFTLFLATIASSIKNREALCLCLSVDFTDVFKEFRIDALQPAANLRQSQTAIIQAIMMQQQVSLLLISALCGASAFSPSVHSDRRSSSALSLLPTQGSQLEAAFNAACVEDDDVVECTYPTAPTKPKLAAARNFAARIFHLPSSLLHPKESSSVLGNIHYESHQDKDDVVLYPIVGFRLFQDDHEHVVRAFPTTSHPACSLPLAQPEQVYGWFSAACPLAAFDDA